jgi:hypothetical protein
MQVADISEGWSLALLWLGQRIENPFRKRLFFLGESSCVCSARLFDSRALLCREVHEVVF